MRELLKQNAGSVLAGVLLLLTASRIYAFSGYNLSSALGVMREAGTLNVGLAALLNVLPSIFATTLLYGAVYWSRHPQIWTRPAPLVFLGLVLGFCFYAVPWTLLVGYAAVALLFMLPTTTEAETGTGAASSRLERATGFIRDRVALPAIGFSVAAILVGTSGSPLPLETMVAPDGKSLVGFVVSVSDRETVILIEGDRKVVRVPAVADRQICVRDDDFGWLRAPSLAGLRADQARYPQCPVTTPK